MRIIKILLLAVLASGCGAAVIAAERGGGAVRAILVVASNGTAKSDPRLAPYEPTLRQILRFTSYRVMGEGSTALARPGSASIALGGGHALELEAEKPGDDGGVRVRVRWHSGGQSLLNTGLVLRPGLPAVLGGPSAGKEGEVLAIILVAG